MAKAKGTGQAEIIRQDDGNWTIRLASGQCHGAFADRGDCKRRWAELLESGEITLPAAGGDVDSAATGETPGGTD